MTLHRRVALSLAARNRDSQEVPLVLSSSISDFGQQMVQAYAVNDRMNQLILKHLDPRAWHAQPPSGNTRTIAAIFAHVHNVRCKWLRLSAPHLKAPARLDRARSTQKQARAALAASAARCCEMLADALNAEGRIQSFVRDGWARPWQPGPAMFAYMISHEAHHRGQVCMLAHQLGFPLPFAASQGLWGWEKLWKECGFKLPSGNNRRTKSASRMHLA
jgi:uncharacterized damage-inducible protein DinB